MNEREAQVLSGVVREYIRTARPVGSSALAALLPLEVSSATIRSLLQSLEEQGYLVQPHTSAGRIPTDQGYRFYVDHLRARALQPASQDSLAEEFAALQREYRHLTRAASKLLAKLSRAAAVSHMLPEGEMQEAGLRQFLNQPEGEQRETVREMSAMLEDADKYLVHVAGPVTQVYIGRENPFFSSQHISLVVRSVSTAHHHTIVLAVVGPKRMHYQRNISLINALADIMKEHVL